MKTSPRLAILSLITASATTENAEAVTVRKLIKKKQHKLMTIKQRRYRILNTLIWPCTNTQVFTK